MYVLRLRYDYAGQYYCVMRGVGTSANVTVYVHSAVTRPPATGNVPSTVAACWNRFDYDSHAFCLFFVSVANILGSSLPSQCTWDGMVANNDGMLFVPARFVGGQFYVT